jgi:hypothetical protein
MIKSLVTSNVAFLLKAVFAFALTTFLANNLSTSEFASWSVLISLSLFFTLSDFGIGQYILRYVVELKSKVDVVWADGVIANALFLLALILVFFYCVFFVLSLDKTYLWGVEFWVVNLFFISVLLRSLAIPFLSLLSAFEYFHIRKIIEALTYFFALVMVVFLFEFGYGLQRLLLMYAAVFLVFSIVPIFIVLRLGLLQRAFSFDAVSNIIVIPMLKGSVPYFVNNLSLLVTRGGMIFFAGMLLLDIEVAALAIYFAIFYQVVFQFFDIIIRCVERKMLTDRSMYKRMEFYLYLMIAMFMIVGLFFGGWFLDVAYPSMEFNHQSLYFFVVLGVVEILYAMVNAKWQMVGFFNKYIFIFSVAKAFFYLCFYWFFYAEFIFQGLDNFLAGLVLISFLFLFSAYLVNRLRVECSV